MSQKFKIVDAKNQAEWDEFVTSHDEANFLQSWDFYEFYKSRGNEIVRRIAIADEDSAVNVSKVQSDTTSESVEERMADSPHSTAAASRLQPSTKATGQSKLPGLTKANGQAKHKILAAYAGVVEKAKRGRHLAIGGGPILDWAKLDLVEAIFADMRAEGQKHDCVFVRVRPQLERSEQSLELMARLGAQPAPMYLSVEYAGILDLTKSEEEILAGMRQRLRRALRKGAKNDIKIEKSTNPADIHEFYQIQLQTAGRHGFIAFSEDFLTKQFAAFAPHGEAVLYTAKLGDEILAQNFMIFYGNEASYHYGVSSELGTKLSGAPLLHMEAMRDARERGIRRYNFWGIVGEDETWHRFYGVSQFKRGFGVDELKYVPAHDLVLKPGRYAVTKFIENVRKKKRHV